MRDHEVPPERSAVDPTGRFPLPDADAVTAAWSDHPSSGEFPPRRDKAKTLSRAMLVLGVALLLVVPLGGALFLVAGGLGLAISSDMNANTAIETQSSSSADH
jgi:hypothetical protein